MHPRNLALPRPTRLSQEEIQKIHQAILRILEAVGLRFCDDEALDYFKKAGAEVSDGNLVKIPAKLLDWALAAAPSSFKLYNRLGEEVMDLGGDRIYYGPGSDCPSLYDPYTGQRRRAKLEDCATAHRVADALEHVDYTMSMLLPEDVPMGKHEPYQFASMVTNSVKPIVFVGEQDWSTISALEMAAEAVGGMDNLTAKPFVINYVNTVNCFLHNEESVKRTVYAAKHNIPTIYSPSATRGLSAPITAPGAVAVGMAGRLAGVVLTQLVREGSPVMIPPAGGTMDLRTMVALYCPPDTGLISWDVVSHYNLPVFGFGGCSDAKIFDAQAAGEAVMSMLINTIGGANLIHDLGYLDSAMTLSYENLAWSDEAVGWIKRYFRPQEINDETLALNVIEELGPDGDYMRSRHTFTHVREDWMPKLMDRNNFARWKEMGSTTLSERANERIRHLIETHQPEPLPDKTVSKIFEIRDKYVK